MRNWQRGLALAGLATAVGLMGACEDSPLVAPEGSTLQVQALPSTITLDVSSDNPADNDISAATTIRVTVIGANGVPEPGVEVVLTTTSGVLTRASADDGFSVLETGDDGRATDTLTVFVDDPEPIEVTASSGLLEQTATVTRQFIEPNTPPVISIQANPANQASKFQAIELVANVTDPNPDDTFCYLWQLEIPGVDPDPFFQGNGRETINVVFESFSAPGNSIEMLDAPFETLTVGVSLQVSDDPALQTTCRSSASEPLADNLFNSDDLISYVIVCDDSPPTGVDAGINKSEDLAGAATVDVSFQASLPIDMQSGIGSFLWSCGADGVLVGAADELAVTCRFDEEGFFGDVSFTATNRCGGSTIDTVGVTIFDSTN